MRSELLCLTAYLDGDTATRAAYLYVALSRACHYHLYELATTATELTRWLNKTADLVKLLRGLLLARRGWHRRRILLCAVRRLNSGYQVLMAVRWAGSSWTGRR
jgi:hypothetical protein